MTMKLNLIQSNPPPYDFCSVYECHTSWIGQNIPIERYPGSNYISF